MKNHGTGTFLTTAALAAVCATAAVAGDYTRTGDAGEGDAAGFLSLDANQDGVLNKDEVGGGYRFGDWETVDLNEDGVIDRAEFSAFEPPGSPGPDRPSVAD